MSLGRRIYQLRRSLGMDQKAFARALGTTQGTISRWESDGQEPKGDALLKIAKLGNVTLDTFLGTSPGGSVDLLEVVVMGDVQAGLSRETYQWPDDERFSVAAPPDPRYPGLPRFGLVIRGPSMNDLYPDGTVVICIKTLDLSRGALPGEKAIVCRRDGPLVEATCKEIRTLPDGSVWAWPRSNHPDFQEPWKIVNNGHDDDPDVWIDAIVVGSYRLE